MAQGPGATWQACDYATGCGFDLTDWRFDSYSRKCNILIFSFPRSDQFRYSISITSRILEWKCNNENEMSESDS